MRTKTIVIALATCALAYGEPEKKEGERPQGPRGYRPIPDEILEKFDTNKDGKLDADERKAMMEARRKEMLAKFDKDGDGKLDEDERKAMMEEQRAEMEKRMLERFDKDGDGKLSEEERQEARKARADRPARGEVARGKRPARGEGPKGDRPARGNRKDQ